MRKSFFLTKKLDSVMRSFNDILGIHVEPSLSELREAYKQQIETWNPAKYAQDKDLYTMAQRKTREIEAAFDCLKERIERKEAPKEATTSFFEQVIKDFDEDERKSEPQCDTFDAITLSTIGRSMLFSVTLVSVTLLCLMLGLPSFSLLFEDGKPSSKHRPDMLVSSDNFRVEVPRIRRFSPNVQNSAKPVSRTFVPLSDGFEDVLGRRRAPSKASAVLNTKAKRDIAVVSQGGAVISVAPSAV